MIWLLDRIVRLFTQEVRETQIKRPALFMGVPVPIPPNVSLRRGWLVFPNANATTYGHTIVFRKGCETLGTLVHELVHVGQWNEYGFFGFLWRYVRNPGAIEAPAYRAGNRYHVGGL